MEIPEGFEVVDVPLYEVRYLPESGVIKAFDDGRTVEFYGAEEDQYVLSYNDQGAPEWKPVRGYSVHHGCAVVLINLTNGLQIVSDHDPRAVVGVEPTTPGIELHRYYPDEAMEKRVLVPCTPSEFLPWDGETYYEEFQGIWEAMACKMRLLSSKLLSRLSWDKTRSLWIVQDQEYNQPAANTGKFEQTGFLWTAIESVTHTGKKETGYDLTVPGYETFMSAEGVILSNTMNVSLPSMSESVQEAKDVLMPSKMLLSIKSPDTIVPALKHEQILGLYTAKNTPAQNKHKFATEDEALDALRKGDIRYSDDLEIG
jgi:hypothetical protein